MKLDRNAIDGVVRAVADRLDGDWLLVGGGLVALRYRPERETEDVDIFAIEGAAGARLALLDLALELGLPIEALNSAADFFVQRVHGWRDELEPLVVGARGRVLAPTPTLFLLTKIGRLSEEESPPAPLAPPPAAGASSVVPRPPRFVPRDEERLAARQGNRSSRNHGYGLLPAMGRRAEGGRACRLAGPGNARDGLTRLPEPCLRQ